MANFLDAVSALILLSAFLLMAGKRVSSYIRMFRLQSFLIALGAGVMGFATLGATGRFDLLIVCAIILALKVIVIPKFLKRVYSRVEHNVEKDFFLNIPLLVLISCGIVIFVYFIVNHIAVLSDTEINTRVVISISVVLMGTFFMITRKHAIDQIIGFLTIENGLFVTALFATHGMPFIIDLGIFVDLLTGVLVMGLMTFKINENFDSTNINKLKNLRG